MTRLIIALVLAVASLGGLSISKVREEAQLRDRIEAQADCLKAVAGDDTGPAGLRCPAPVAATHRTAVQARACDQALLGGDLFLMRTACTTEVKTLFAAREAETARADGVAEQLAQERAGQAAAITRAEVRVRTETERKLRAEAALSSAPRNGDRLVLDAGRLRQLQGDDAAAR